MTAMRKKQKEISDWQQIEAILRRARIGRLATSGADGYPYITPVNYVYFRGAIYFHCARVGEKLSNIERDDRVCFAVDLPLAYLDTACNPSAPPCEVSQLYQSVVIRGRAAVVAGEEEKLAVLNALMACHEGDAGGDPGFAAIDAATPALAHCLVVAIRIESLSAKAGLLQGKGAAEREKVRGYLLARGLPGDRETAELLR
jgi:uncharacterized protein